MITSKPLTSGQRAVLARVLKEVDRTLARTESQSSVVSLSREYMYCWLPRWLEQNLFSEDPPESIQEIFDRLQVDWKRGWRG